MPFGCLIQQDCTTSSFVVWNRETTAVMYKLVVIIYHLSSLFYFFQPVPETEADDFKPSGGCAGEAADAAGGYTLGPEEEHAPAR